MMILKLDQLVSRILRRAAKLRLRVQCRTTQLELDSLHRTACIHLAPREWGRWAHFERGVLLEIDYGTDQTDAANDDSGKVIDARLTRFEALAVFRLIAYGSVPLDQYEERVRPLLDILRAVFKQKLCVDYSVIANYEEPPKAGGATVGVRFRSSLRPRSCDLDFLDQVAAALRWMGPGSRVY